MVQFQHAGWQCVEHSLVQAPAKQADKPTAEFPLDFRSQVNVRAKPSVRALKYRMAGRSQIARVNADQPQDFLRRRPKVENVAGRFYLAIPFEQRHLEADAMRRQCGGHTAGPRTNNGDMSPF